MSELYLPSYEGGFATSPGEARNSGEWNGLFGHWAATLGPTGTTLRDASLLGNHGALTSMDPNTDWVAGEEGYALDFDGSNDQVIVPHFTALYQPIQTVSVWCRSDKTNYTDSGYVVSAYTYSAAPDRMWGIRVNPTSDKWAWVSTSNPAAFASVDTAQIVELGWHHLAIAGNAADQTWQVFYDGKQLANVTGQTYTDQPTPLRIGSIEGGFGFDGEVASVTLHDRILTLGEIQLLYEDRHAIVRPRQRVFAAGVAGVIPTPYYDHFLMGS